MSVLDGLLNEAVARVEAEEAARVRRLKELKAAARKAIIEQLGDLWEEIQPHVVNEYWEAGSGFTNGYLKWYVQKPGFQSFSVKSILKFKTASPNSIVWHVKLVDGGIGDAAIDDKEQVAKFLLERKVRWDERKELERQQEINGLSKNLERSTYRSLEEGAAAWERLMELAPERASDWKALHQAWQARFEDWQAQRKAEAAEKEALRQAQRAYRMAIAVWSAAYDDVLAENDAIVERFQRQYAESFQLWRLTYSIAAMDESIDERCVETAVDMILRPIPLRADEGTMPFGSWLTVSTGGDVTARWYNYVVSVEGPVEMAGMLVDSWMYCKSIWFKDASKRLHVSPHRKDEVKEIEGMVLDELRPLPAQPDWLPFGIEKQEADRIVQAVQFGDDEFPF